jgi:hypothetical protein
MILKVLTVLALLSALASGQWPWSLTAAVVLLGIVVLLMLLGVQV